MSHVGLQDIISRLFSLRVLCSRTAFLCVLFLMGLCARRVPDEMNVGQPLHPPTEGGQGR
jgi:hypothetical protein